MAPGKYPGSSGTRNLHDNLSDLRAQVAANQKVHVHIRMYTWSVYPINEIFYYFQGVNLVRELISDYGLNVVQAYMNHIQVRIYIHVHIALSVTMKPLQENAELGVREMLMEIGSKTKVTVNETNQCSNCIAAY